MTSARDNLWESVDGSFLPSGKLDSLTSSTLTHRAAERPTQEDGTIVTEDAHDSDGSDSSPEGEDSDEYQEDDDCDSDSEISSCFRNANNGVPAEVKLVPFHENGNDVSPCRDDSDSEPSDEESDEEDDDGESEHKESVDGDTASEYETDEDGVESERSEEDGDLMDESSCGSAPSRINDDNFDSPAPSESSPHELFLPWDVSPSIQSLKYEEEDDESSDEEDEPQYYHRTYMIGSGRSGRPRMWDGCPCGVSVSSDSGSSSGSSQGSNKRSRKAAKTGVSFSDSVMVYPVFETAAYPSSVVKSMYTKREELRVNKLRNKREFAYDLYDWQNATEEEEMEYNDEGEPVHPVHCEEKSRPSQPTRTKNVVQTYSSALGGYTTGVVHRAKRMRMYYP